MKETLFLTNYNNGMCSYLVEKETSENNTSIIVYDVWNDRHIEKWRIKYNDIGDEYSSPFLNWYNVLFCSNNYGP